MISSMVLFFRRDNSGLGPAVEAPRVAADPVAPDPVVVPTRCSRFEDPAFAVDEAGAGVLVAVGPEVPGADGLAAPNKLGVVAAGAGVELAAVPVEAAFPKRDGVCAGADADGAGVDVVVLGFPNKLLVVGAAGAGVVEACVPGVLAVGVAEGKLKDGAGLAASVVAAGVELAGGAEAAGLFPPNMLPPRAGVFAAPAPPNKLLVGAAAAGVPPENRPPVGAGAAGVCVGCDAAAGFGVPNKPPADCG